MKASPFILLFLPFLLHCQAENYLAGYYLTKEGQRVEGRLNRDADRLLVEAVSYLGNGPEPETLSPDDISGFSFGRDDHFQSIEIDNERTGQRERVFARVLLECPTRLLRIQSRRRETNQDEHELPSQLYAIQRNGKTYKLDIETADDHRFRGTLRYLMQDQPATFALIDETAFRDASLINLISEYERLAHPRTRPVRYRTRDTRFRGVRLMGLVSFAPHFTAPQLGNSFSGQLDVLLRDMRVSNSVDFGIGVQYTLAGYKFIPLPGDDRTGDSDFRTVDYLRLPLSVTGYQAISEDFRFLYYADIGLVIVRSSGLPSNGMNFGVGLGFEYRKLTTQVRYGQGVRFQAGAGYRVAF